MPPTKLQRWLDLIAFLAARHFPVAVEDVMLGVPGYAARYENGNPRERTSTRRMFERDKVELREAGVPIETVECEIHDSERIEGYRLSHRDFYLPYLRLLNQDDNVRERGARAQPVREFEIHEDNLRACLACLEHVRRIPSSPLAEAASSARRKLTFDLPVRLPTHSTATLYLDPPGLPDSRAALEALSAAVIRRKAVTFRYHGIRQNRVTDRRVEPYGLVFGQSRWYLVARDEARDDVRSLRVNRKERIAVNARNPRTRDFDVPPNFDLDAFASRAAWQLGSNDESRLRARVLFSFPLSLWAERNGHGELVSESDDGSSVREFEITETGRRVCEITYLKPGAEAPESRRVRPYVTIHGEGSWYVLAHCEHAGAVRAFLLERVLSVTLTDERFERPADFDPGEYLDVDRARVLDASGAREATVRYSPVVARWLAERHEGAWSGDGSFIVRHQVTDARWLVRTVLQYAGEAEVLAPPDLRTAVADAAHAVIRFAQRHQPTARID